VGRNPNTALIVVAGVLAVTLLGVIGVGALYLSGAIGGSSDFAEENRDDNWQVNPEATVQSAYLDDDVSKADTRAGGVVPRMSPDAYQTETSSGPVEVKITSARLGRLPEPGGLEPDKEYLLVTLELRNTGAQEFRYSAWDGQSLLNLPIVLTDSSGRRYRQKVVPKFDADGNRGTATRHVDSNAHPVYVTDSDFDAEVLRASEPVLVDFYADWCPPCRALAPTIDRLAGATAGKAKIVKVDVDKAKGLARRYGIRGIPHLILFHNGEIVAQNPGRSFESLLAAINRVAPGAGETVATGETLEPHGTVEQTLFFEPGQHPAEFLRLELPADAIGGQGMLTLEIPWTMIVAAAADSGSNVGQG
jgi:thioredoxin 1